MIFDQNLMFVPLDSFGDLIVVSAIIRHISCRCNHLCLPVNSSLVPTAQSLFEDDTKIFVIDYQGNHDFLESYAREHNLLRLKGPDLFFMPWSHTVACPLWDEQWYSAFEIGFSERYLGFRLPTNLKSSSDLYNQLVTNPRYILVHRSWSRELDVAIDLSSWRSSNGFDSVDHFQTIEVLPSLSKNLLDWVELIRHAEEIHCVPSSFFCLADSMCNKTHAKLFFHNIRADCVMRVNNRFNQHKWCMIHYDRKL